MTQQKLITEKTTQWLEAIASGELAMSQRKVSGMLKAEGSLEGLIEAASEKGVHLVRLTDDLGNDLIAGSCHAFEVLC